MAVLYKIVVFLDRTTLDYNVLQISISSKQVGQRQPENSDDVIEHVQKRTSVVFPKRKEMPLRLVLSCGWDSDLLLPMTCEMYAFWNP